MSVPLTANGSVSRLVTCTITGRSVMPCRSISTSSGRRRSPAAPNTATACGIACRSSRDSAPAARRGLSAATTQTRWSVKTGCRRPGKSKPSGPMMRSRRVSWVSNWSGVTSTASMATEQSGACSASSRVSGSASTVMAYSDMLTVKRRVLEVGSNSRWLPSSASVASMAASTSGRSRSANGVSSNPRPTRTSSSSSKCLRSRVSAPLIAGWLIVIRSPAWVRLRSSSRAWRESSRLASTSRSRSFTVLSSSGTRDSSVFCDRRHRTG